uniref:Uncharacterized protein n=1 Tax=Pithovirus LCPAC302 TaxID=2506593 RepID=A0A481Z8R3_9VIRU|nr:MAG: uncharacterized protein LCPAC302_01500 [Pithovirus LCPAC302]
MATETDNNIKGELSMAKYSDKSYVVFGESTKAYRVHLKSLGGKFNGRLKEKPEFPGGPAWIFFSETEKSKVIDFVESVNKGKITTGIPDQGEQPTLPTVIAPGQNKQFQTVRWKVFKPEMDMSVTIKAGGAESIGEVIQIESHRNVIDTVYVDINKSTSKLVICNGRWQVLGYMVDHSVFFNKKDMSPENEELLDI